MKLDELGVSVPEGLPRTTDGQHPMALQCLVDAIAIEDAEELAMQAGRLVSLLAGGRCPRCSQLLELPVAGSVATPCLSIPVCADCVLEESTDFHPAALWPNGWLTGGETAGDEDPASFTEAGGQGEPVAGLWPLSEQGGGPPEVESLEDAAEQVTHYKRIASLRKRTLEAALLRIQVLEDHIRSLGDTPPPWDVDADGNPVE